MADRREYFRNNFNNLSFVSPTEYHLFFGEIHKRVSIICIVPVGSYVKTKIITSGRVALVGAQSGQKKSQKPFAFV